MATFGTQLFGTSTFNGPGVDPSPTIDVPPGTLTLTGYAPFIAEIPVPTGTLTLTGLVPNAFQGFTIDPPTGALALTGFPPLAFESIVVPTGALTLTGFAPAYAERPEINVPAAALILNTFAPNLAMVLRFRKVYSIHQEFTHRISYSLQTVLSVSHRIQYGFDVLNPIEVSHRISYGLPFQVAHRIAYGYNTTLEAAHRISYGLLNAVSRTHRMSYDITSVNPVSRTHRMRYSLVTASILDVTGEMQILLEISPGVIRSIGIEGVDIGKDEDDLHWTCKVQLTDINDYALFQQDDPFTVDLFGEQWEFIVDAKELSRNSPSGFDAELQGVSPTANDDLPRALPFSQDYLTEINARAAVEGALSVAVDWQIVDWEIPPGRLAADRASPVDFSQRIVSAAGGVLEAKKDGTWLARHRFPVSPLWYSFTAPDHVFNEADKILNASEQFVPGRVVNRIRLTDRDANFLDVIEFVEDDNNPLEGDLNIYPSPFRTTVQLLTTALPADIQLTRTSPDIQTRLVEDPETGLGELVEFLNCEASTVYPVDSIDSIEWVGINLGAVSFEQGAQTLTVPGPSGYGLARIRYNTRFLRYRVLATQPIDAQFILEDIS